VDDASLITFVSDFGNKLFYMENVSIDDVQSNGDFIKIFGNLSIVNILNSTFNNVISYGSLIINNSLKVSKIFMFTVNLLKFNK